MKPGFRIMRRSTPYRFLVLAAAILACGGDPREERPPQGEFVLDHARLVPAASVERMNQLLSALRKDTDIEIIATAVESLHGEPITAYSNRLFERWEVGHATRGNRGLLLVIAKAEEEVRLEVGYALEGIFTDAFVSYIEHEQMVPYFHRGRVGEGIEATVELVARRAYDGIRGQAYDPNAETPPTVGGFRSGGGGADADVPLDGEPVPDPRPADDPTRSYFAAQATPEAAWERFLELNRRRIKATDLGIYDDAAKRLLGVNSSAGQDHIARLYDGATPTVRREGERAAVVFLDDPDHLLAPWFFHRTGSGWQLDGGMYPDVIGYNHRNQWFFRRRDHAYIFAFADFRFDRHGFAFYQRGSAEP